MSRRTRRLASIAALAAVPLVASCTPKELRRWQAWHAKDPVAAEAYAATFSADAPRSVWDDLAECESGGVWDLNTGNGYYGGLQFSLSSWHAVGGSGAPDEHSRAEQIRRAEVLLAEQGWGAWPSCASELGLR
jgi:resuscitation-promoting factor RpfB